MIWVAIIGVSVVFTASILFGQGTAEFMYIFLLMSVIVLLLPRREK